MTPIKVRYWLVIGSKAESEGAALAVRTIICSTAESAIDAQAAMRTEGFLNVECSKGVQHMYPEAES